MPFFYEKIAKRSSDYRKCILIVTKWFQDNCANHLFKSIFLTLYEIQEILYSTDKKNIITVSIAFVFNFIYSYACDQNKYLWQASRANSSKIFL